MSDILPPEHRTVWKLGAICFATCLTTMAVLSWLVGAAPNGVTSASAQDDGRKSEPARVVNSKAALAVAKSEAKLARVAQAPHRRPAPRPQAPVLISRVDPTLTTDTSPAPEAVGPENSVDTDDTASTTRWTPSRSDTYRTVCVRMCDGAYSPVSFSTTRDRFKADAARCSSQCGSPARLYIVKPGGEAEDMVDLRGNPYVDLPNAFKFRTSYDAGCTCHGQPWETAQIERHRQLTAEANAAKLAASIAPSGPSSSAAAVPVATAEAPAHAIRPAAGAIETAALGTPSARKDEATGPRDAPQTKKAAAEGTVAAGHTLRGKAGIIAQAEVRKPTERGKAGKLAVAGSGPGVSRKQTADGYAKLASSAASNRALPRLAMTGVEDDRSMQRPFRPKEYWRLSYWEQPNF